MSDGTIKLKIEVDDGGLESDVESAGKKAGEKAGDSLEKGVKDGASKGAKDAESELDGIEADDVDLHVDVDAAKAESDVKGVGSSGKQAGAEIGAGIEQGMKDGASKGSSGASSTIEGFGSKMKGALAGIAAGAAFGAIGSAISDCIEVANEFQEDMGKLTTAAKTNGVSNEAMNRSYRDMVGVLGETDQSVEAVNHVFQLCGNSTEDLNKWTTIATGVYGTFGDSLPIEGLTEAANETAKVAQVTGPMADALNWASEAAVAQGVALNGNAAATDAFNAAMAQGMSSEDAFNAALQACSNEQERQQLITETLSSVYQDAADVYDETNGSVIAYRQSQSDLTQAQAELGKAFMPVSTALNELGTALISVLIPALEGLNQAFTDAYNVLQPLLQPVVDWFAQQLPVIAPILAGIATTVGILALALNAQALAQGALNAVMVLGEGVTNLLAAAQAALNLVMSANPIALVIALIAGLVVAIIGLYNTNEDFRNFVDQVMKDIWSFVSGVVDGIVNFFTNDVPNAINNVVGFFQKLDQDIESTIKGAGDTVAQFARDLWGFFTETIPNSIEAFFQWLGAIPGKAWNAFTNTINAAWNFVGDFANAAWSAASDFASNLWNGLSGTYDDMLTVGWNIVVGIWNGLAQNGSWLWSRISGWADGIVNNIKRAFGIHSPSRVMRDEVGKYLAQGVEVGFDRYSPAQHMADTMRAGVSSVSMQAANAVSIAGATVQQTVNFNQPVQTPSQLAQTMRLYSHYGLAGQY